MGGIRGGGFVLAVMFGSSILHAAPEKFYVEPGLFYGFGFKGHTVGQTTKGEDIKISGGGGFGGGVTAGAGLTDRAGWKVFLGLQESGLTPEVSNAKGSFKRNMALVSGEYKVPLDDASQAGVRFSGGLGIYSGGKLNLDFNSVAGGNSDIAYDDGLGFHAAVGFERRVGAHCAFSAEARFVQVSYKAKSFKFNGQSLPVRFLVDDIRTLNGGGLDLIVSLKVGGW